MCCIHVCEYVPGSHVFGKLECAAFICVNMFLAVIILVS